MVLDITQREGCQLTFTQIAKNGEIPLCKTDLALFGKNMIHKSNNNIYLTKRANGGTLRGLLRRFFGMLRQLAPFEECHSATLGNLAPFAKAGCIETVHGKSTGWILHSGAMMLLDF